MPGGRGYGILQNCSSQRCQLWGKMAQLVNLDSLKHHVSIASKKKEEEREGSFLSTRDDISQSEEAD